MTLHFDLPPEMQTFVERKVASGSHRSATEVIGDALRRMQDDEARVRAWQAAIREGDEELDRGQGLVYTPELLDEITGAARAEPQDGRPVEPDVRP